MSRIVGTSLQRLNTCHPDLRKVMHEASEIMDFSVTCGVRSKEDQNKAFAEGKSKLRWPQSKHNLKPGQELSEAVDVIPYFPDEMESSNYDWKDQLAFARLAGVIFAVAARHGIKIRWGGDWDMDFRSRDQDFNDLPHFELIRS